MSKKSKSKHKVGEKRLILTPKLSDRTRRINTYINKIYTQATRILLLIATLYLIFLEKSKPLITSWATYVQNYMLLNFCF